MTKGGYVDSSRRIRSLYRQQDDLKLLKFDSSPTRSNLLPSIGKSSSSAPATTAASRKIKAFDGSEFPSSVSMSANPQNKKKEFDKQMRLIKVCLSYLYIS